VQPYGIPYTLMYPVQQQPSDEDAVFNVMRKAMLKKMIKKLADKKLADDDQDDDDLSDTFFAKMFGVNKKRMVCIRSVVSFISQNRFF
jgi:hypothetical protein